MTPQQFKVFENRMRASAKRQGLRLTKSRRRDPWALDHGGYWLIDIRTNGHVAGGEFGTTLADVARHVHQLDEEVSK